jgi:vesicle coat complex subunit
MMIILYHMFFGIFYFTIYEILCFKMIWTNHSCLVTLLSAPPEVQYIALRNINLILQRRPDVLNTEMRVLFCKYNDPPYVKLEKLEIMIKLASEKNVDQVVSELKEYVTNEFFQLHDVFLFL